MHLKRRRVLFRFWYSSSQLFRHLFSDFLGAPVSVTAVTAPVTTTAVARLVPSLTAVLTAASVSVPEIVLSHLTSSLAVFVAFLPCLIL